MQSDKRKGRHRYFGKAMLSSFWTVVILSIMRWPHNIHLLSIGVLAIKFYFDWLLVSKEWTRYHTICMGASYILWMAGFYVDNGNELAFLEIVSAMAFLGCFRRCSECR